MVHDIISRTNEIDIYLKSIRKYQVLTPEQEEEVIKAIREGDEKSKTLLINSNQRWIYATAKNDYAKNVGEILDYVSEGTVGLIKAISKIDNYDSSKGFRFMTFARWYIIQAMSEAKRGNGSFIRKSNEHKLGNSVWKIRNEFILTNGREPSLDELKDILFETKGIKIKEDCDLLDITYKSINDTYGDDDAEFGESGDFAAASAVQNEFVEKEEQEEKELFVQKLLSKLDDRSADILKMSFGIGYDYEHSDEDIAAKYDLTTTRIGQLRNAAMKKLKSYGIAI